MLCHPRFSFTTLLDKIHKMEEPIFILFLKMIVQFTNWKKTYTFKRHFLWLKTPRTNSISLYLYSPISTGDVHLWSDQEENDVFLRPAGMMPVITLSWKYLRKPWGTLCSSTLFFSKIWQSLSSYQYGLKYSLKNQI